MSEKDTFGTVVDLYSNGMNMLEIASELAQQGWVFYDALEFTANVYKSESLRDPIRMGSNLEDMRKRPPIDIDIDY